MRNQVKFISKLKKKFLFKDGCIFVKFYLISVCVSILVTQFVGRTGSKPRKWSRKWLLLLTDLGGWVGDVIQNQTSSDFRFPEVGISNLANDLEEFVKSY